MNLYITNNFITVHYPQFCYYLFAGQIKVSENIYPYSQPIQIPVCKNYKNAQSFNNCLQILQNNTKLYIKSCHTDYILSYIIYQYIQPPVTTFSHLNNIKIAQTNSPQLVKCHTEYAEIRLPFSHYSNNSSVFSCEIYLTNSTYFFSEKFTADAYFEEKRALQHLLHEHCTNFNFSDVFICELISKNERIWGLVKD